MSTDIKTSAKGGSVSGGKSATSKEVTSSHRVRIKIRAYDHKIIDQATRTILETAERTGVKVVGPVPLPTEKKKWTVNRSTFVHKNAREQFEMRIHKRIVDILDPNPKTIDALTSLNLPAGVDVEIKM
ncbi:30S ribosomal protein S10 [Candidatus Uhrbacteria bacterium]|nr:30S ribosomal protein S10 [Candidatus Uhrbacteria bacterium]